MVNLKITELTSLTTPAITDVFTLVDISDVTMDATGTTKKITFDNLQNSISANSFYNANGTLSSTRIITIDGTKNLDFNISGTGNITISDASTPFVDFKDGGDVNIKGSTDTALFYTDFSTNSIGVGVTNPSAKIHVLNNSTSSSMKIFQGGITGTGPTEGALVINNDVNDNFALSVTSSNNGTQNKALSTFRVTNDAWTQPIIEILKESGVDGGGLTSNGSAPDIRIKGRRPEIEFFNTNDTAVLGAAHGIFEILVKDDRFKIGTRKESDTGFEFPYNFRRVDTTTGAGASGSNFGLAIGLASNNPKAYLHITEPGTANRPPFMLTTGTLVTTPKDGAIEYDGVQFYGTAGTTRRLLSGNAFTSNGTITKLVTSTDSVGIGIAIPVGKLDIVGDKDQQQLHVKGFTTQTNDIVFVEKSDGTNLFKVSEASTDVTGVMNIASAGSVTLNPSGGTVATQLRFSELTANGTNYVGFEAPAVIPANQIWILPSTDGVTNSHMTTDGAGNLSFQQFTITKIKGTDQSKTNDTVMALDNDLQMSVGANEKWTFSFLLMNVAGSNAPDIKMQLDAPAGTTVTAEANRIDNATNIGTITALATPITQNLTAVLRLTVIEGSIITSATAGTFGLSWAQNTSNANVTTVQARSSLVANKAN